MGFVENLWDESIAGPTPISGLGKLRKHNSFSVSRSGNISRDQSYFVDDQIPVSRTILLRSNSASSRNVAILANSSSLPSSPVGSSTPTSPFSPTSPRENNKKLTRRKSMVDPRSPKGYDWIVLSALDRL